MSPPDPELPDTRDRECPTCASQAITPANPLSANDTVTKEEFRCTACVTAFWVVRTART